MNRIFLVLAAIANAALAAALLSGWRIGGATSATSVSASAAVGDAVTLHFLAALGGSLLALLVHAVTLTYLMGTGRWIEETSGAYRLGEAAARENVRLKYRVIPGMIACVALLVVTGAFGAVADPASDYELAAAPLVHFALAVATLAANLLVSWFEHDSIVRNGRIVVRLIEDVRRIRREKGLDVVVG